MTQFKLAAVGEPSQDYKVADSPECLVSLHKAFLRPSMDIDKEHLHVILLDTKLKAIGWHLVSLGTVNETVAHVRDILRPVIVGGAYGFALMHNHPSGEVDPSRPDRELTRRLNEAATLMQLRFVDHVIVGDRTEKHFSFRNAGLI